LFAIAGEKKIGFSFGPYLLWVVIGIVVAAAIILAYLFWPTKGEKPGSAYGARSETKLVTEDKKKESSSEKSSLSDKFSALKEKWSKKDRPGYQGS
jgi:Flp pilus assembly protein TadB